MPRRKSSDEEDYMDPGLIETVRPYGNLKMRVPSDARMSENIEDRRGDAFMYGNKLAAQKTRGKRMEDWEKATQSPANEPYEQGIERTIQKGRKNAPLLEPDMTPSEERSVLDRGENSPEYQARVRARDRAALDELLNDLAAGRSKTRADKDAMQDLINRETRGYAKGGMVSKGRGDGICTKGHTKGRMY